MLRHTLASAIAIAAVGIASTSPASADAAARMNCSSTDDLNGGQVTTTSMGCAGSVMDSSGASSPSHGAGSKEPPPPPCAEETVLSYHAPAFAAPSTQQPQQYDVRMMICPNGVPAVGPVPVAPISIVPVSPTVSTKALVDQARKNMNLPLPQMVMTPAVDATQLVSLPIWLQLQPSSWVPKSATVSAGGVSLTMTAVPVSAVWSMGDGTSVTCPGPGTPYPVEKPKDPMAGSPDCGHTYTAPSDSLPQGSYPVSVVVHWKINWSTTTGLSGAEPDLTAVSSTRLRVAEIQALVTKVGS
ncbi:hypothetical protein [Catenulispora pinisilvae]|uniref:hypothetical protein n=1 Tax=Catenulispora pinisilvae TaxID=2705253 RepID=UPI001891367E|nr:hypothetical protein [Catenulispora pinisilvae]